MCFESNSLRRVCRLFGRVLFFGSLMHPEREIDQDQIKRIVRLPGWGPTIYAFVDGGTPKSLENLSALHFDIGSGDLALLNNHWYVTHTGLLRMAKRRRCSGNVVEAVANLCDSAAGRYVFKATAYSSKSCKGFVGYGDADPFNVSALVRGAEMRVAETRAVNRALRKAYGIGICSLEEIGTVPNTGEKLPPQNANGNGNGTDPKVRVRLCQIIWQH